MMPAAAQQAAHPFIHSWQPATAGAWSAVPTAEGGRCLRKRGWQGFAAGVAAWAGSRGLDVAGLRAVSALPPPGPLPPRPRMALLREARHEGPHAATLLLEVPYELAIYQGHFPTVPIVPGAMLAGWAVDLAARHAGWTHGLAHLPQVKFRRIVQPGVLVRLELRHDAALGRLDFSYRNEDGLHSMGTLLAAPPAGDAS